MTTDPETENQKPASWFRIWAELAGAWAIALAHPIYQNIASGPEALTSYGVRRPDLLVLVLVVSLLGPFLIALLELVIRRVFGERPRIFLHGIVIGALLAVTLWQWLLGEGSGAVVRNLFPLALCVMIAWLYVKTELVRNFALMLSFATVVVIVIFLASYPIRDEVLPHESAPAAQEIDGETPVVMVVFDEFPLAILEGPDGKIDRRFPTFSSLAREANWYPDMLGASDQTLTALPTILNGQDPDPAAGQEPPPPGLPDYPDNICQMASAGGYELHAFEPITDLCERNYDLGTRVTGTIRRGVGADDDYLQIDLAPYDIDKSLARLIGSPFDKPHAELYEGRREAFGEFTEGLPGEGSLSLLHITLPHIIWMYSPDGTTYPTFRNPGDTQLTSPESEAEIARDMQQLILQTSFTDRELGKLVQKMKDQGTWDESLFIVTADHGASFLPGGSRRLLDGENNGWVLPVPLFIKYPGQQRGQVVRGSVDSRDITPTIMDVLGLEPGDEVTGQSLVGRNRLPREDEITVKSWLGPLPMKRAAISRHLREAVAKRNSLLGQSFYATGGQAELLGRNPRGLKPLDFKPTDPSLYEDVDLAKDELPSYFQAEVISRDGKDPGPIAVALNGRVVATSHAWPALGTWYTGVNLPNAAFRDGANVIRLYEATPRQQAKGG